MHEREESRQLDGHAEIDGAYLGGELPGGKSGHGSKNKAPLIAALRMTEAGHPLFACLTNLKFTKDEITQWTKKSPYVSAHVVSDGLWCFQTVTVLGAAHKRIVTGWRSRQREAGEVPGRQYPLGQSENRVTSSRTHRPRG